MRKLTYLLAGLVMTVGLWHGAIAAWNIVQKDDGTAAWRSTTGDTGGADIEHPIGSVYLNVLVADLTQLVTVGVVSPITGARVTSIRSVLLQDITGSDVVFAIYVSTDLTGSVSDEVTNGTGRLTIAADDHTGIEIGDVDIFTPTGFNTIELNQVILIQSLGATTAVSNITQQGAMFTITLERR